MSLRALYRKIPEARRLCVYCDEPILRNIDRDKDGRLYHHGCLLDARAKQYHCIECNATFDWTEATLEEAEDSFNDEFRQRKRVLCPYCGTSNFRTMQIEEA